MGGNAGPCQTETYVFPVAVATQPAAPAGFPTAWDGTINGENVAADYAMTSVPGYTAQQVESALRRCPRCPWSPPTPICSAPAASTPIPTTILWRCRRRWSTSIPSPAPRISARWWASRCTAAWDAIAQYLKHCFQISFDQSDGPSLHEREHLRRRLPAGRAGPAAAASTTAGRGAAPTPNSSSISGPATP